MKKEITFILPPIIVSGSIGRITLVFICFGALSLLAGCVTETTTRRVSMPLPIPTVLVANTANTATSTTSTPVVSTPFVTQTPPAVRQEVQLGQPSS